MPAAFSACCAHACPAGRIIFYILSAQPAAAGAARTAAAARAALKVSLPSWVDRPELVLDTSADGVTVLEHERWAAPLSDLVAQTLARNIERRRGDVLVFVHGSGGSGPAVKLTVDIVQVRLRRGQQAHIEAHWRILDTRNGRDSAGGDVFSVPLSADGYAAVAQALSECLGLLADRLAGQIPLTE